MEIDPKQVTRVEVIDEHGRAYGRWFVDVDLSVQDAGRTLKVFLTPNAELARKHEGR